MGVFACTHAHAYSCMEHSIHTSSSSMWWLPILLGYINDRHMHLPIFVFLLFYYLSHFLSFSFSKAFHTWWWVNKVSLFFPAFASAWLWPQWPMLLPSPGLACISPYPQSSSTALSPPISCLSITHLPNFGLCNQCSRAASLSPTAWALLDVWDSSSYLEDIRLEKTV